MKNPTIRIVTFKNELPNNWLPGIWVEQLRRLGVLTELAHLDHDQRAERQVLEFAPPRGVSANAWCEMNAERMRSFGINAVVAPKWEGGDAPWHKTED